MFLFLPGEEGSVDELVSMLDGDSWNNWLEQFSEREDFTVSMPKFKFEYEQSLRDVLMNMGLEIAFTDQADFSGISSIDLLISDVIHKTYIDVNEEGTEAAAVTAIIFGTTSAPPPPPVIDLNRPFLMAIRDTKTGAILFMGAVNDPRSNESEGGR